MITDKQQEILDSIENEDSRAHYRAQFEMQNELGDAVHAGGIFDASTANGFLGAPGYPDRRQVLRAEVLADSQEVTPPELALGVNPELDAALDAAERAAGLGRIPPEDLELEPFLSDVDQAVKEADKKFEDTLAVVIMAIVVGVVIGTLMWWLS